ncbi:hypothetical protein L3X38_024607 [Prunus dulcis]|uniref:Uncharacterized protein n=1 Tax=Prunus dulcis TaxID=3755 RepID=A0AAD4W1R3_PRUDU|nr:hypothetical protein L3X38_024607 [Prunus dulcis]
MRKWQEKLIRVLEKEFLIYNYENGKAREQLKLSVLQGQQNKSKQDEDIAMKQLAEQVDDNFLRASMIWIWYFPLSEGEGEP